MELGAGRIDESLMVSVCVRVRTRRDSGQEFRNWAEFRNRQGFPKLRNRFGVPRNSVQHRLNSVFVIRESTERDQCRIGLLCSVTIEFPESDRIDSGAGTGSAMFNIAE
jgi:hypothetical protein